MRKPISYNRNYVFLEEDQEMGSSGLRCHAKLSFVLAMHHVPEISRVVFSLQVVLPDPRLLELNKRFHFRE